MRQGTVNKVCGSSLLFGFCIVVALGTGWIINCVKFARLDFKAPVKAEIIRGIGLLPPVGAVVGWITIDDTPCASVPPVAKFKVVPVD